MPCVVADTLRGNAPSVQHEECKASPSRQHTCVHNTHRLRSQEDVLELELNVLDAARAPQHRACLIVVAPLDQ